MSHEPRSPRLTFLPRPRGSLELAPHKEQGFIVPVRDFAFTSGSGRIVALRVAAPGVATGEGLVAAAFTTPLREGRVRVPPARAPGWLRPEAPLPGVRWAERCRAALVLDCGGDELGRVRALVVEHHQQRVLALVLEDGGCLDLDDATFLADGRILIEDQDLLRSPRELRTWRADDRLEGRMWWTGELVAPQDELLAASAIAR